jgi:type II secretory pathway component GspD/PulD (secretin)
MSLRFLVVITLGLAVCVAVSTADPAPAQQPNSTEANLDALFSQLALPADTNINDLPLFEVLQTLSKRYSVNFVIAEEHFKAADVPNIKEKKPNIAATQLRGVTVHQFLTGVLEPMRATYLVKGNAIEIVPLAYAAKLAKVDVKEDKSGNKTLTEPLVSLIVKEKPLNETVALLARRYDLSVVVSPQSGDAKTGLVTAQLLNVPADKALELLVVQCDLYVIRKGKAFLITSRAHADELFDEPPVPKERKVERDLLLLFDLEVQLDDSFINDMPLFELLQKLSKRYGVNFVIADEHFKAAGVNDSRDQKPNVAATQMRGMTLHQFLTTVLDSMGATYLVKESAIEIVPLTYAAKFAKTTVKEDKGVGKMLAEPLVSLIVKEKPLNEAVALLARRYELNVVISPQSGVARTEFVTARLLNVTADKALELLALQCDLCVVRKGNVYLITSRDHANEMFNKKLERERQLIELEKLRQALPPKPEPKPEPKADQIPPPRPTCHPRGDEFDRSGA